MDLFGSLGGGGGGLGPQHMGLHRIHSFVIVSIKLFSNVIVDSNKPGFAVDRQKKLMTTHFSFDHERTFTMASTNESPGCVASSEVDRKISASTRTGTILKLPIA